MTGLHIHRSNRVEFLAHALSAQMVTHPPSDPFDPAWVVVGSRGMAQWLRHALADVNGICANVRFLFPEEAFDEILASIEPSPPPRVDPWAPEAMALRLLGILSSASNASLAESLPGFEKLPDTRVIGKAEIGIARAWAETIDRYVHYRPDWLARFEVGEIPRELEADSLAEIQAELYRRLRASIATPHFADRLAAFEQRLEVGEEIAFPVERLHVFGLSALPPLQLAVLDRLAKRVPIVLYLLSPSNRYWGDLRTAREAGRDLGEISRPEVAEALEESLAQQNPLLTALGKVGRDFQLLLEDRLESYGDHQLFHDPSASQRGDGATLLEHLQADVLHLAEGKGRFGRGAQLPLLDASRRMEEGDRSIELHGCHGPLRQVEVLRDALLQVMADDPTLEPRDVLVMTPDVETFGPLVIAAFTEPGIDESGAPLPSIPVFVADRAMTVQNPLADVTERLLSMVRGRVTAPAVLDLLSSAPVARRFGIDAEELRRLRRWVAEAGIRWAVDEDDRARHAAQPPDRGSTFRFGLERLALGAVSPDAGALYEGVLPVAGLEGEDVGLFGRFAAFCTTLFSSRESLRQEQTLGELSRSLAVALGELTDPGDHGAHHMRAILSELDGLTEAAVDGHLEVPMDVGGFLAAIGGRFERSARGERPITGGATVCAFRPMRSVPFRVVCLLGMDEGAFPRNPSRPGFDLTEKHRRIGDRSPRDEDRHLLLEAILSARDHLLVTYGAADVHTGERRPPAVPIAELLDVLEGSFAPPGDDEKLEPFIHHRHPLQPFSPRAFVAEAKGAQLPARQPSGVDERMRRGALRSLAPRRRWDGIFEQRGALDPPERSELDVDLDRLTRFLAHPVAFLLRERLGLVLRERSEALDAREPIDPDALAMHRIGAALLDEALDELGDDLDGTIPWERLFARSRARGELPLGMHGARLFEERREAVARIIEGARRHRGAMIRDRDLRIDIGDRTLYGRVPVDARGISLRLGVGDPQKPKRRVAALVRLLALVADGVHPRPEVVSIGDKKGEVVEERLALTEAADRDGEAHARAILERFLEIYDRGLSEPLPLAPRASMIFAKLLMRAEASGEADIGAALAEAEKQWEGGGFDGRKGEREDPAMALVFPSRSPFRRPDDDLPNREALELAEALWRPFFESLAGEAGR